MKSKDGEPKAKGPRIQEGIQKKASAGPIFEDPGLIYKAVEASRVPSKAFLLPQFPILEASGLTIKAVEAPNPSSGPSPCPSS